MRQIESRRLLLEPMSVSHAAESMPFWQNDALYRFMPGTAPGSLDALVQRYTKLEKRSPPDGGEHWLNWFMRDKVDADFFKGERSDEHIYRLKL